MATTIPKIVIRYEYDVLREDSIPALAEAVDKRLADGWVLVGGVAVSTETGWNRDQGEYEVIHFHQAITRTTEHTESDEPHDHNVPKL